MNNQIVPPQGDSNKRGSKAFLFGLLLLLIFFVIVIAMALFTIPKPRIDYVAQTNALNKPANYDPNNNAALDYLNAFELLTPEPNELPDWRNRWPTDMNETQTNVLASWVQQSAEALEYVARASQKPYCWFEYEGDFLLAVAMQDLKGFKYAAYALAARARLNAAAGNVRPALEDVLTCYRVGASLAGQKTLIEQAVGIAVRALSIQHAAAILARTDIGPATLAWFADQLDATRITAQVDLAAEQLMFRDVVQRLYTRGPVGSRLMSLRAAAYHGVTWRPVSRKKVLNDYGQMCAYYEEIKRIAPYDLKIQGQDVDAEVERIASQDLLTYMLMPALWKVIQMSWRERTDTLALDVIVALLRYSENEGRLPETLQALVQAGYLTELPSDPFGPGPFTYVRRGDTFILYSWGMDTDDDGGTLAEKTWAEEGDRVFWPVETADNAHVGAAESKTETP